MSIFKRISNIFKANINVLVEKTEDPVKMLDQVIEEMRKEIAGAKKTVADAISQEKLIKKDMEKQIKLVNEWKSRAEKAVEADRDDLAREALQEKNKAQEKHDEIRPRWEKLEEETKILKNELQEMEDRFQEVQDKKKMLQAKAKVAKAYTAAVSTQSKSIMSEQAEVMMDRARDQVELMVAQVEAQRELHSHLKGDESKFKDLEQLEKDKNVDEELAKLKKKLKG